MVLEYVMWSGLVCPVITSLVTRHQCTVTVESCQSTQGGLAQQAGASYTRRGSCDSSCLSSHCPTHGNAHTHL